MNVADLAVEADVLVIVLGAQHDVGNVAEPDDDAVLLFHDELTELLRRAQVGVGDQVHRHHGPLRPPERRKIVVPGQRASRSCEGEMPYAAILVGLEPDPHGEGARHRECRRAARR